MQTGELRISFSGCQLVLGAGDSVRRKVPCKFSLLLLHGRAPAFQAGLLPLPWGNSGGWSRVAVGYDVQ